MRVAGHDGVLVLRGLRVKRLDDVQKQGVQAVTFALQIHADIERDLIVAGACGVELFADVSDALGQDGFDKHVDILRLRIERQRTGLQIGQDPGQTVNDLIGVRLRQNAAFGQHGGVRHRACDILLVHPSIDGDGGVERVRQLGGLRFRASGPELFHKTDPS